MPFIISVSGRHIDPWESTPDDIDFSDIAIGLSNVCRWAGQLTTAYSVAEHSLAVARLLDRYFNEPVLTLQGLLHDSPEAFIGDLPTPLKHAPDMGSFRSMDTALLTLVLRAAHLPDFLDARVKSADKIATVTEARDLCPWYLEQLQNAPEYLPFLDAGLAEPTRIVPIGDAARVRAEFLTFYQQHARRINDRNLQLATR